MKKRSLIVLALLWGLIVVGFQWIASSRYQPALPDYSLVWTEHETKPEAKKDRPYLLEPIMNNSVAWDSEYYLSIAVAGYDDPQVGSIEAGSRSISKNYAFLPFYPLVIKIISFPFILFMNPIAAAALAGTIVSILGACGAALALFLLVKDDERAADPWKVAFYFLVFPSSFFLAQVYTEGLFLGLAFGTLALLRYGKLGWAALLAVLAVWTKVVGVCLAVPLVWSWFEMKEKKLDTRTLLSFGYAFAPIIAFLLWHFSILGKNFDIVEMLFFNRVPLNLDFAATTWSQAFMTLFTGKAESRVYYLIEFAAIGYGIIACILTMKEKTALSIFGLLVILLSLTSGASQGMHRYILAAPSVFIVLGRMGSKSEVFDRAWSFASILLFGMMATLYTFDMWVG